MYVWGGIYCQTMHIAGVATGNQKKPKISKYNDWTCSVKITLTVYGSLYGHLYEDAKFEDHNLVTAGNNASGILSTFQEIVVSVSKNCEN